MVILHCRGKGLGVGLVVEGGRVVHQQAVRIHHSRIGYSSAEATPGLPRLEGGR